MRMKLITQAAKINAEKTLAKLSLLDRLVVDSGRADPPFDSLRRELILPMRQQRWRATA